MYRACMVVHATYPDDARVRREAEALLDDGWEVDVICIRGEGELPRERCNGALVYRLPVQRHRGSGLAMYLFEYMVFFVLASIRLLSLYLRRRYDIVQIHNMPDFLVFTALIPRLLGARVVLDIHDLVPELYQARFTNRPDHPAIKVTRWAERASTAFADHVITAGEPFQRRLVSRGVPADKVTVIMNSADPRLFRRPADSMPHASDRFVLVYHGGIFTRYGLDIAIQAVEQLRHQIPGVQLLIYGEGEATARLEQLVTSLDLGEHVRLGGFVGIDRIPGLIAQADLGVVPYRSNSFTNMLFPTKAFECLAMGIPVVMAHTEAVAGLFGRIDDAIFRSEDIDDLAARILALYRDPERRRRLLDSLQAAYAPYAWENQRREYVTLMRNLVPMVGRSSPKRIP